MNEQELLARLSFAWANYMMASTGSREEQRWLWVIHGCKVRLFNLGARR